MGRFENAIECFDKALSLNNAIPIIVLDYEFEVFALQECFWLVKYWIEKKGYNLNTNNLVHSTSFVIIHH